MRPIQTLLVRFLTAPVVVVAMAACGGSDQQTDGGTTSVASSGGGALQSQADGIRQCLDTKGISAEPNDAVPALVQDPTAGITMHFTSALGDPTGGDIWVFSSHEIAVSDRPKITLATEDNQVNEVVGADVVDFHGTIPSKESKAAVESCL